ncbi:alpha/beta hydrolase [Blastochloris viridis]|uniref:Palmitoyl-protein thioesterase ABHD10, mitochondrial n=1 Tax=Blastochloris viridis TaxID=1079 RepID=A0A0H5BPE8_BLAVI|nr:alpha/beta hydrolase [Blastochloris viridis]ALK10863.1 Putative aminoacrylate hydrolase RutD [Blastochloris viridis]BAR99163.1 2-hydroxymuconic semialdehyde hydrolase [Blastochloris viridis]CUU43525.1 acetoin dehydrogenase E2 subunit dihydrolipoyllysine-residue acetyltransferase [Blastochloris viridis]
MDGDDLQFLAVGTGAAKREIAVRAAAGRGPMVLWCGGFRSDMGGTKAVHLAAWAASAGRAYVRFDYSGHGESEGRFEDGTIGRWAEEAQAVLDAFCPGETVVVGSSMGGWVALLLARALLAEPGRLKGMVLVAPAPDFTEDLMWPKLPPEGRRAVMEAGAWLAPSQYGEEPYPITRGLIEDGRTHLLLGEVVRTGCPVRILQGMADPDVPWQHTMTLVERLAQDDAALTLIKDGDHRLSRPEDLTLLVRAVEDVSA